jgi:hypothetical protein
MTDVLDSLAKLELGPSEKEEVVEVEEKNLLKKSTEELKQLLESALSEEDYEKASRIRDELNNRKKS